MAHQTRHATTSWPGLSRPSMKRSHKDLDARDSAFGRAGHDDLGHTLTSGSFGTGLPPEPEGPFFGFLNAWWRGRFLAFGFSIFSGRGVIGPSGYSKPSVFLPSSSLITTRTWPPFFKRPNSTSSASGCFTFSWMTRDIGRAPI